MVFADPYRTFAGDHWFGAMERICMTDKDNSDDLMQEGFGAIVWPAIMAALVLGGWAIYGAWSAWQ